MKKLKLDFIISAKEVAENEMKRIVKGTNLASSVKSITVFEKDGKCIAFIGSLHDKVDAPCIEFEMRLKQGDVYVQKQHIFQEEES